MIVGDIIVARAPAGDLPPSWTRVVDPYRHLMWKTCTDPSPIVWEILYILRPTRDSE